MLRVQAKLVVNNFPQITAEMRQRVGMLVQKTTHDVEAQVKVSMQAPKAGRLYPRAGGKMHQASAPGEAPAVDYGNLINSIQTHFPDLLSGYVYTDVEYAAPLEFGGVHVAARPFMIPAANAVEPNFFAGVAQIIG